MKFVVDVLPYYNDDCIFDRMGVCAASNDIEQCPRFWDKYFVTSDDNPHECALCTELEEGVVEYYDSDLQMYL